MAVLIERTSLVLPVDAVRRAGAGGALGAAASRADDGDLVALSFGSLGLAREALVELGSHGLLPVDEGEPGDVAIVDQRRGPMLWWPWIELATVEGPGGGRVLAARLAGRDARGLATPPRWTFAGSASEAHGVARLELVDRPLRHVRRDRDADVYADRWTGDEIRLARGSPRRRVAVEGEGGRGGEVTVEVSSSWEEVEVGLMFRESLAPDEGMLFRFRDSRPREFWMKNTLVPLDLLFVGEDGRVVNVAARAAPQRIRTLPSAGPARAVLEVPGGWCAAHGVGAGARVAERR